jgi:predicted acylesterase/phospholipase RssA
MSAVVVWMCVSGCGVAYRNVPLDEAVRLMPERLNATRATRMAAAEATRPADWDGVFVGVAISGGGSRSALFSAACMFELQKIGLLDRVDYLSAVSGGTLTAAYYCVATDAEWTPAAALRRLAHPFASDAFRSILLPWHYLGTMFTALDRSDILARQFEHVLFSRDGKPLTFADLRPDRPRLLLNATDLQSGRRFVFSNQQFDRLNSDLSRYPLAWACTASSSVPVLLHPVTLRDFSTPFEQYVHLIDGGVNDNLGVVSLVDAYTREMQQAVDEEKPLPYPRGAVFIVLDARTFYDARLGDRDDIGLLVGLESGAQLSTSVLLNRVSDSRLEEMVLAGSSDDSTIAEQRAALKHLRETGETNLKDIFGKQVVIVDLSLTRVKNLDRLPSAGFFDQLNKIATYFNIQDAEAFVLHQAAQLLVADKFGPTLELVTRKIVSDDPTEGGVGPLPADDASR